MCHPRWRRAGSCCPIFPRLADQHMRAEMESADLDELRIHERVAWAVETRPSFLEPHREAVHRGLTWLSLPQNALLGTRLLYRTVDDMHRNAVGDKSADFSFYTKRGLLAGVFGSTMLCWLDDQSEDAAETKSFLRRRIADVMKIHGARKRIQSSRGRVFGSLAILKAALSRSVIDCPIRATAASRDPSCGRVCFPPCRTNADRRLLRPRYLPTHQLRRQSDSSSRHQNGVTGRPAAGRRRRDKLFELTDRAPVERPVA